MNQGNNLEFCQTVSAHKLFHALQFQETGPI